VFAFALVLFAISLPLMLVLAASIGIRLFWKVRAKGYRGPVPGILFAVAIPIPVLSIAVVGAVADGHQLGGFEQSLLMLAAFALLSFLIVIIAALVVRWLPVRRPKARRRVRAPYRTFGVLVAMATPVVAVLDARTGSAGTVPRVIELGLTLSAACLWAGRRTREGPLGDAVAGDDRLPVLYLRSFDDDLRPAILLPRLPKDAPTSDAVLRGWLRFVTIDEFLRPAVRAELGPFIALGDPADYLAPRGAAHGYVGDAVWREELSRLVEQSQCLVAAPGTAAGLVWEFDHVKRLGCVDKLYVLTAPSMRSRRHALAVWLQYGLSKVPSAQWSAFADAMATVGYDVGPDPGPGSIVTFTGQGTPIALCHGARAAEDYVAQISRRVGNVEAAG
jgi:hypothetical protein